MNQAEITAQIRQKSAEVHKLISEINSLKRLMQNEESPAQNILSEDDKITIFMSYFKGRDTVYPYLSINKQDPSKKTTSPNAPTNGNPVSATIPWAKNAKPANIGPVCP